MNEEEYKALFDEAIKSLGGLGRYHTEYLEGAELMFLSHLKEAAQIFIKSAFESPYTTDRMPYVHIDIIDDMSFNASAFSYKGKEFIGVNIGSILILNDLFNRILSNKNNCPEIGDVSKEKDYTPLPFLTTNYAEIQNHFSLYRITPLVFPVDPLRQVHARTLTRIAWLFLIGHEIAHLRFGHVQYTRALNGNSFILEYDSKIAKEISPDVNKVLEWTADIFSATQSAAYIHVNIDNPKFFRHLIGPENRNPEKFYQSWILAIWVLFRLMDAVRQNKGEDLSPYYPSPSIRLFNAINVAVHFLDQQGLNYKSEILRDPLMESLSLAETCLCSVSNLTFSIDSFSDLYSDSDEKNNINFLKEYHEIWNNKVRDELEPYSRGTDLKPKIEIDW